jgi:transposase
MKIQRSTKLSFKWLTTRKRTRLREIMSEYSRVCNAFIDLFWQWSRAPENRDMLAEVLHTVPTVLSQRFVKEAAREAVALVRSVKCKPLEKRTENGVYDITLTKPRHRSTRMVLASTCAEIQDGRGSFDLLVRIKCIGGREELWLPTRKTKHYNKWAARGSRATTIMLTERGVQLSFEIDTGPKTAPTHAIGVDTGMTALAACSDGTLHGTSIKEALESLDRKKYRSKAWYRAKRRIRHIIDTTAREVVSKAPVIVVEKLKGITFKTKAPKRRLGLKMRRFIGRWNVMYWLGRIQAVSEECRASFRSVLAFHTSTTCSVCGHSDKGNRLSQSDFTCLNCGHKAHADLNASVNIGRRFTAGPYGSGCQLITG